MTKFKYVIDKHDIWLAYRDCRQRKRGTDACSDFERYEAKFVDKLWYQLSTGTYVIGLSNAFIITKPKYREVFAAAFADRVVHHFLMLKTLQLFEDRFIDDSYNCRKGKGTTYGVNRLYDKLQSLSPCWILKCDLQGFFMSIDKPLLADRLDAFLRQTYKGDDLELICWLTNIVVCHRPELKCRKKGDVTLWKYLPANKSLFTNGEDKGMAIGNLTSQIYANFYMSFFDLWIKQLNLSSVVEYGRYVDDFYILCKDKKILLYLMAKIRRQLKDDLLLQLHPHKWYLQHSSKGIKFIGTQIKQDRKYVGSYTVSNMWHMIKEYKHLSSDKILAGIERFARRYNSFTGFMKDTCSYSIRVHMWDMVPATVKQYCYIVDMRVVRIKNAYKHRYIQIQEQQKLRQYAKLQHRQYLRRQLQKQRKEV